MLLSRLPNAANGCTIRPSICLRRRNVWGGSAYKVMATRLADCTWQLFQFTFAIANQPFFLGDMISQACLNSYKHMKLS